MPDLARRRRLLVLAICCSSLFIVGLDNTIVNLALPAIRRDLGSSLSGLQWVIDAYTLVLAGLCTWIAGMRQFEVEGVRLVIRFTARASLVLFCLAFGAGALARLWPNGWTRWQRRNRRYLGVSFAASHAIHAVAIAVFAAMDPLGFMTATSAASYWFGGIGYAFIIAGAFVPVKLER